MPLVYEPKSVNVIRALTAGEKLAVWDVNGKVIKGCGKAQIKNLITDNFVP